MFTEKDLRCTVNGGAYESGSRHNKKSLNERLNSYCAFLATVDATASTAVKCCRLARLALGVAGERPLRV